MEEWPMAATVHSKEDTDKEHRPTDVAVPVVAAMILVDCDEIVRLDRHLVRDRDHHGYYQNRHDHHDLHCCCYCCGWDDEKVNYQNCCLLEPLRKWNCQW
jgi:hypothetical protein